MRRTKKKSRHQNSSLWLSSSIDASGFTIKTEATIVTL